MLRALLFTKTRHFTSLTGLATHPEPKPLLLSLYRRTLSVASRLPSTSVYRQSVEAITSSRLKSLESAQSIDEFVKTADCGLVEELIIQAQDELKLLGLMENEKPWEKPPSAN